MQYKFVQHTKKQKNLNLHGEKKDTHAAITQMLHLSNKDFFLIYFIYLLFLAALGLGCCAWASHCSGFSCCGARVLGAQASVVVARGLSSCGLRALEHRLSSCGARA